MASKFGVIVVEDSPVWDGFYDYTYPAAFGDDADWTFFEDQLPSAEQLQQCDALFVTGSSAAASRTIASAATALPEGTTAGGSTSNERHSSAWAAQLLRTLPELVASTRTIGIGGGCLVLAQALGGHVAAATPSAVPVAAAGAPSSCHQAVLQLQDVTLRPEMTSRRDFSHAYAKLYLKSGGIASSPRRWGEAERFPEQLELLVEEGRQGAGRVVQLPPGATPLASSHLAWAWRHDLLALQPRFDLQSRAALAALLEAARRPGAPFSEDDIGAWLGGEATGGGLRGRESSAADVLASAGVGASAGANAGGASAAGALDAQWLVEMVKYFVRHGHADEAPPRDSVEAHAVSSLY